MQKIGSIQATADTLGQLVEFLVEQNKNSEQAIQNILLINHPAFDRLKKLLSVSYRVFFTTRDELSSWLSARTYRPSEPAEWDTPDYPEWINTTAKKYLRVNQDIFDANGRLRNFTSNEWEDEWIQLKNFIPMDEEPPPE